jgi:hypothetical protein
MWDQQDDGNRPRPPVAELEILPPGRAAPKREDEVWVRQRVFIAKPSPFGAALALLALAAFAAAGVLLFLGLFFFLLPVLGVMAAAGLLVALLRGPRRL